MYNYLPFYIFKPIFEIFRDKDIIYFLFFRFFLIFFLKSRFKILLHFNILNINNVK